MIVIKCAKISFAWGYAPDPAKRAYSMSITAQTFCWNKGDLLLREGDGCRTAERSLSILKRLPTYLHNSLSQRKMSSLLIHVYREEVDNLVMNAIVKKFILCGDEKR